MNVGCANAFPRDRATGAAGAYNTLVSGQYRLRGRVCVWGGECGWAGGRGRGARTERA